jgi:hypothetical protein
MTKKSFKEAPEGKQPTDAELHRYVNQGTGTDTSAKADIGPTRRLSVDLTETLHTRFKTACSATKRKMAAEITAFIEKRTAELESEAGISRS